MTDQEIIDVVSAHMRGEKIQTRDKLSNGHWLPRLDPVWNFASREYRVKPKPREWWLVRNVCGEFPLAYSKADIETLGIDIDGPTVHVREILEDE